MTVSFGAQIMVILTLLRGQFQGRSTFLPEA